MRYSGGLILCLAAAGLIGCGSENSGDQASSPDPPVPTAPGDGGSSSPMANPHSRSNPHAQSFGQNSPHSSPHASSDTGSSDTGGSSEPAVKKTGPYRKEFAPLTAQVPEGWQEIELKPIQQGIIAARFRIPAEGAQAELTCSAVGGGIPDNVARWHRQFGQSPPEQGERETLEVDGVDVTWVDLSGTFKGGIGPAGGTKENWRMLAAAVPLDGGQDFYFKLTGPRKAVGQIADQFRTFVESVDLK